MSKAAVIYYSRKGENYWNGSIKTLAKGNTEVVAEMIAQIEDADLFEVETCRPYAADYHECTQEALKELREQARPQLKRYLNDLTGHDPIYVGFPTGGAPCPWPCFPVWSRLIFAASASCRFAPTRAAAWVAANRICEKSARARQVMV